jgi:S-adenosylmethionine-diacylglycerol 3-amino-3-carboxypropyl transferase
MLERARAHPITRSVVRKGSGVANRLLDHTFALAFRGLVYAQIWEDPEVDIEALQIRPDSRMVAIASGGCNVLSYLVADPQAITAVDLNTAHIALNRLKLASARHLPATRCSAASSPMPTAAPTSPPTANGWPRTSTMSAAATGKAAT